LPYSDSDVDAVNEVKNDEFPDVDAAIEAFMGD
jgi:hypothetical protein